MNADDLKNMLRILCSTDRHEIETVLGEPMSAEDWFDFSRNPADFMIRCREATARAIWAIVEARHTRKLVAADEAPPTHHANGAPMWAPDGTLLNDRGTRSIFDDLDA